MENPAKSLKYLEEMESLGEEILTDRQEIIALDRRRHETREGLRELKSVPDEKIWFALGPLLVKLPTKQAENILKKENHYEQNERWSSLRGFNGSPSQSEIHFDKSAHKAKTAPKVQVDAEINKLRSDLKVKVNNLRDMEHKPPVPGLMLKAMSPEEMKAVGQVLGRHVD